MTWGWMKDRDDPEARTPDRQKRLYAVKLAGGDVEAARALWTTHTRQQFLGYLVKHGTLNEWGGRNDERR